jgi:hypothetical protein
MFAVFFGDTPWREIGDKLGVSLQAEHRKYGRTKVNRTSDANGGEFLP